mmetsp:Transcript_2270/g.4132  ORF Transcript_2270/g.4132 Transcript_2270/m.4132 type:complete len:119 (-) Transcript_2270:39-395(-)
MKSQVLFDKLAEAVREQGPSMMKAGNAVFRIEVEDAGHQGVFLLDLKNGKGSAWVLMAGGNTRSDVTVKIFDDDMWAICQGKFTGKDAFMMNKLRVKGSDELVDRLFGIIDNVMAFEA